MAVTLWDVRFEHTIAFCSCGKNKPRWRVTGTFTLYACRECVAAVAEQVS